MPELFVDRLTNTSQRTSIDDALPSSLMRLWRCRPAEFIEANTESILFNVTSGANAVAENDPVATINPAMNVASAYCTGVGQFWPAAILPNSTYDVFAYPLGAPRVAQVGIVGVGSLSSALVGLAGLHLRGRAIDSTSVVPQSISANWMLLAKSGLSEPAYKAILRLGSKPLGWNGPGSFPLDARSLTNFLNFWIQVRNVATEPDLVLTPKGNIQAEWFKSPRQFLEIDFRSENEPSFFGLFDNREVVLEGSAPASEIMQIVLHHRNGMALTWR